jgi:hypothetical protein
MSVDGRVISSLGLDSLFVPEEVLEEVQEVFVRIHPMIKGASEAKAGSARSQGFPCKDRRFVLKSIKDDGKGVACIHYIRSTKKQGKRS